MAVSFVARKCTQCAGKLQYVKDKKLWKCLYCGAEIEREEQYDGLFTIKNVVRQVLLDVSCRRMDSAAKNLVECEKIDSRYIGTLIAKISWQMVAAITPGAVEEREVSGLFSQLKRNYEALRAVSTQVSDDEEALYDFFAAADIFATLLLVYDSLGDQPRREFVVNLLDPKEVYSLEANRNLLSYLLKHQELDTIDTILSNTEHLDLQFTLSEILGKYPDGLRKSTHLETLFSACAFRPEDRDSVEQYLATSQDSVETKACALICAHASGVQAGLECAIKNVLAHAGEQTAREVLSSLCSVKLGDENVYGLLEFAFSATDVTVALAVLESLESSGQFVLMPQKYVVGLLARKDLDVVDKEVLLRKTISFKMDAKGRDAVVTNYLCFNDDPVEHRLRILSLLLEAVDSVTTGTVETYVLKCTVDGTEKPRVLGILLDLGLNMSFFHNLLSHYIGQCPDDGAVKAAVVEILTSKGLVVNPASLIEYICDSGEGIATRIDFVKKMIAGGAQLRSDTASAYLERTPPGQFSPEFFSLIFQSTSSISEQALSNYLLLFREREAVKAVNFCMMAGRWPGSLASIRRSVAHLGNRVTCNLLQAYLLTSTDSATVTQEIVAWLVEQKLKINAEMEVAGGMSGGMKLKKYVLANRQALSPLTDMLCDQHKVYSMLF